MKTPPWIGSRQYIDKPFWVLFITLIVVAIISLFSAGSTLAYKAESSALSPILQQILFIALGVGCAYIVQLLPTWMVRIGGYAIWGLSFLCLLIMLIPGNGLVVTINGAGRWINLFGLQFQPSELTKLGLIIVVADQLARIQNDEDVKKRFFWTLGLTAVTCFPIMTGNMSTAILLAGIVFLLWILARIPWKYLTITAGSAILFAVLFYVIVKYAFINPGNTLPKPFDRAITQVGRIDDMIAEFNQPAAEFKLTDDNYQRSIAKVAVMRGGKTPFGVGPGNSRERDILPLAYADYIFAIIVEETGLVGAGILIFIYLAILFRACYASSKYENYGPMLMTMGLALMITCQAFVSMAVAVGLGPVTGQPLPMICTGGTTTIITSLYFGVMMCVAREQNEMKAKITASARASREEAPTIDLTSINDTL
ncbi:MAG: FtsW/RodA/SpoVE family cell cycle protein [Paludibacteraceae bacterium]|nr:FtsW/RodA/SpoVE family cell cycle protein [Paludibacteraceae bacterium]